MDHSATPPLVSVGLPVYNNAETLARALDSLLAQDYPNFEIVVVDDKSTDESVAVLEEYAARSPRLRAHYNEKNLGAIPNLRHTLELCRGDYFAFANGDDYWHASFISRLMREMSASPEAAAAMCAIKRVREDGAYKDTVYCMGNRWPAPCSNLDLAAATITSSESMGRSNKNNMYIHGLVKRELFSKAFASYPGVIKNEREIVCQLALAGEMIAIDEVLFEKTDRKLKFSRRNPHDKITLAQKGRLPIIVNSYRLAKSLYMSQIIPAEKKKLIPSLIFRYVWRMITKPSYRFR